MPHVIVKLWPKPEAAKAALADAITAGRDAAISAMARTRSRSASKRSRQPTGPKRSTSPTSSMAPGTLYKEPGYGDLKRDR